jgi:hypothetical protein
MQVQPKQVKYDLLVYLLLLTGFFFLLEISFFVQSNKAYLSDFTFVSKQIQLPLSILPGILFFLFAQLLLHIGYAICVFLLTIGFTNLLPRTVPHQLTWGIGFWITGLLCILFANAEWYPNSKFSGLVLNFLNETPTQFLFYAFASIGFIFLLLAIAGFFKTYFKYACLVSISVIIAYTTPLLWPSKPVKDAASPSQPNIILIGVDSLRPDFLGYFGSEQDTPFFDKFLEQATVFNEAVTPLARTFPSWISILTGEYPRKNGVRFNLADQSHVDFTQTLPAILKRHGYQTVFATDETRFSNINQQAGFDKIIAPRIGLNDFLLGTFNDFPFSNLVVNTKLGKWLFPYSYANRPAYITYDPNQFLSELSPILTNSRQAPLFLAVHFCLPHAPYLWASLSIYDYNPRERYLASIQRVDQQLHDFFQQLQAANLLHHAIVVLLSDHGEALEMDGDRITEKSLFAEKGKGFPFFYPAGLENEEVNQTAGHGTDVLGLPQYHSLLAFKLYGMNLKQAKKIEPQVVSLMSIKPTVLELAGFEEKISAAPSLAGLIRGEQTHLPLQHIFLESDFSPEAIRTVYPEARKVLLEGIHIFQVNPQTTHLTVKEGMGEMIIHSKQQADIYGNWMLALYPQSDQTRIPILVNLKTGEWTNDLSSSFARQSPAKRMLFALRQFYSDEINKND